MNTKEVFKKEVFDSNANQIGKVVDLIFDLPNGTISHIVVKTGLVKKREIPVELIDKLGDSIVLTLSIDEFNGKH